MDLASLLTRGYFPKELPPPFHTDEFARHTTSAGASRPSKPSPITKPATHNLARPGSLRRRLSIPNPSSFHQLADVVVTNWSSLQAAASLSPISLSKPKPAAGIKRAIEPINEFEAWPSHRARARAGRRYVLRADISTFYPHIYTHSIPWAIHTKAVAKASRGPSLLGNLIDQLVRNGQDGQTIGLPIGPDTSLLLAELLLSSVEKLLPPQMWRGIRHYDDYEFGTATYSEAESCLGALQEHLASLELELNPRKTRISELPLPLEESWTPDLRLYQIRSGPRTQAKDLASFFGKAFQLQPLNVDGSVLKYAVSKTRATAILPDTWPLYEDLILQCATVEPGTMSRVVSQLIRYHRAAYSLDLDKIQDAFTQVITAQSCVGHGSEVAWAIWGSIELGCPITPVAAAALAGDLDPVVGLLALDAHSRGLLPAPPASLSCLTTLPELHGPQWLLAYEASIKGWLPSVGGVDFIAKEPYFAWLRGGHVSFYDASRTMTLPPVSASPGSESGESPSGSGDSEFPALTY